MNNRSKSFQDIKGTLLRELKEKEQENRQLSQQLMASNEALEKIISSVTGMDATIDDALERLQDAVISGSNLTHDLFSLGQERQAAEEQRRENIAVILGQLDEMLSKVAKSGFSEKVDQALCNVRNELSDAGLSLAAREKAMFDLLSVQEQLLRDLSLGTSNTNEESNDPGLSELQTELSKVLRELLDSVVIREEMKEEFTELKGLVKPNMDWKSMLYVLQSFRDLLQAALHSHGYWEYLGELNESLLSIREQLGQGAEASDHITSAAGDMDRSVRSQMATLEQQVQTARELDVLKGQVTTHLDEVKNALNAFSSELIPEEENTSIGETLRKMVTKVQHMEEQTASLQGELEEQRRIAMTDTLTELPNRAAYRERSNQEYQRWKRYGPPLVLALADVDHFKHVNDSYGHQAGDRVLRILAKILGTRLRTTDFIARYGGEEFVILMPETVLNDAKRVLGELRDEISRCPFNFRDERVEITMSFGCTALIEGDTLNSALERADRAMYRAKELGRNRLEVLATLD